MYLVLQNTPGEANQPFSKNVSKNIKMEKFKK